MRLLCIFQHQFRRTLTVDVRKRLFAKCLNREFDTLLEEVRSIPIKTLEESFLSLYLTKSVQYAHVPSIDYLWYRCIIRHNLLVVKPQILCDIGNIALQENKFFMVEQLYKHFTIFHSKCRSSEAYKLELLRYKVESFAKGTGDSTTFQEKWKVFIEDIDHQISPEWPLSVHNFPYLTSALEDHGRELPLQLLLSEKKLSIRNKWTLPVLLNMIMLHKNVDQEFKMNLFQLFHQRHKHLNYDETLTILFRNCKDEPYRASSLMDFVKKNGLSLTHLAAKFFLRSIQGTEYSFRSADYINAIKDPDAFLEKLHNGKIIL
ncbi:LAFE_0H10770g1_1 [Lachancea fermentati]|uniref:LAFE_0H10770g1_1 n=1 Tax=Lachancea fermentati TaxID=4955 RepID=A0A1G4MK98_LACFM|nr:LAFE_0H10770g1_1 [Lachancea fermentati]